MKVDGALRELYSTSMKSEQACELLRVLQRYVCSNDGKICTAVCTECYAAVQLGRPVDVALPLMVW
jgi:hypothetical protein